MMGIVRQATLHNTAMQTVPLCKMRAQAVNDADFHYAACVRGA